MSDSAMPPAAEKAKLFAKMASVMAEMERIPKNGRNTHFNYAYALEGDVTDAVRRAMAKQKLAYFISADDVENTGKVTKVRWTITFADGETGATHEVKWFSEAGDTQDKGFNKAATAGSKYCLLKTFMISTGDEDPDAGRVEDDCSPGPQRVPEAKSAKKLDNEKTAEEMTEAAARAFKVPFGDFKGQILGDIYARNAKKLQESARWAHGVGKFPDFVAAVLKLFEQEKAA